MLNNLTVNFINNIQKLNISHEYQLSNEHESFNISAIFSEDMFVN